MTEINTFVFYIVMGLVSMFFLNIALKMKEKKETYYVFIIFSALILICINVFRGNIVGADYKFVGERYSNIVNYGISYGNYNWFGTGLSLICIVLGKLFGSNPFVFYFFLGTFTIIILYKVLLEECKYPIFGFFIYFVFCLYFQTFNQARQMLAVSIILYATKYIKKENFIKYAICVIIASIFHASALLFLVLYFLKDIELNKNTVLKYFIIGILLFLGNGIIIKIISLTKYSIYLNTIYNISFQKSSILNLIVRGLMLVFCLLNKDENEKENKVYNYSFHMITICTVLQLVTIKYYFLGRLTTYFYSFYIIVLPDSISKFIKKFSKGSKLFVYVIIICILLTYFYIYYKSPSGAKGSGYNNYSTIFNKN